MIRNFEKYLQKERLNTKQEDRKVTPGTTKEKESYQSHLCDFVLFSQSHIQPHSFWYSVRKQALSIIRYG